MNIIKKIFIAILNIILINVIVAFVISTNLKSFITEGVLKETLKNQVINTTNNSIEETPNINIANNEIITDNEVVNEILESKEFQDLLNKYMDTTINNLIDEENVTELEIEKDVLNFLEENKNSLEEKIGREKTEELLDTAKEKLTEKDISNYYNQTIANSSKNIPEEIKTVLKLYNLFISIKFRTILLLTALIDILLLALCFKSISKTFKSIGFSTLFSGIGTFIMVLIVKNVLKLLTNITNYNASLFFKSSIILTIIGIVLIVLGTIINKKTIKKEESNEVSKISE